MKNILLYLSAFVPLYFLVTIKFLVGFVVKTIPTDFFSILTISFYFLLTLLGTFGLIVNMKTNKGKTETIKIEKATNITDQHFLSYFSLFVLFALGFQLTKPSMLFISFFIILFIGIVYTNNKMFYINPFLNILGYNFFEITFVLNQKTHTKKVYYRGQIIPKTYIAHFKNENFSFIEKEKPK